MLNDLLLKKIKGYSYTGKRIFLMACPFCNSEKLDVQGYSRSHPVTWFSCLDCKRLASCEISYNEKEERVELLIDC